MQRTELLTPRSTVYQSRTTKPTSRTDNVTPTVTTLDRSGKFVIYSRPKDTAIMCQVGDIGASIGLPETTLNDKNSDFWILGKTSRNRQACKPTSNNDIVVVTTMDIFGVIEDFGIHLGGKGKIRFRC